jgi:hypothetical protein
MDNDIIKRIANHICKGIPLHEIRSTFMPLNTGKGPMTEGEFYLFYRAAQVYLGDPIV